MSDAVAAASLLEGLNAVQAEAVQAPDGPVLIFAGAGSGKTRVLTHRIAWLIQARDVPAANILAVTFTNKAAREMKDRLSKLVGPDASSLSVGTFHSICARILRHDIHHLGYDHNFVIYDDEDQLGLVKQALRDMDLDEKRHTPRSILGAISHAKNEMIGPEELARRGETHFEDVAARVYARYQDLLRANNAVDFDDLINLTVELFESTPSVLSWYQRRWRYVLVDEFQDTNRPQYRLVRLLTQRHRNLLVVGDDDQSIYSWRGADVRNILSFEQDYPDAAVFLLEQNYRSTQRILTAAHAVVKENSERAAKKLWTANGEGGLITVFEAYNEQEEAQFVVREIRRLIARREARAGECAVLYRMNAQSRALEEAFLRDGVPYRLVGGTRFYERKEVKDILAYLRLARNPNDSVSLLRVLNVPPRGIGTRSQAVLVNGAADRGLSVRSMLARANELDLLGAAAKKSVGQFSSLLDELSEASGEQPLEQFFDYLLERAGYVGFVRDGSPEGEERWQNVQELRSVARDFGEMAPGAGLDAFLQDVALVSEQDDLTKEQDAVTLITLHAAKGLEFPVVFIVGLEEGLFPHSRALDSPNQMEEERRLAYVGMTRAMRHLYLTHAYRRTIFGNPTMPTPSRFLDAIPPSVVKVDAGRADRAAAAAGFDTRRVPPSVVPRPVTSLPANGQGAGRAPGATNGAAAAGEGPRYRTGDKVTHKLFGDGVVIRSDVIRGDEEVTVAFPEPVGIKKLSGAFAPLEKR